MEAMSPTRRGVCIKLRHGGSGASRAAITQTKKVNQGAYHKLWQRSKYDFCFKLPSDRPNDTPKPMPTGPAQLRNFLFGAQIPIIDKPRLAPAHMMNNLKNGGTPVTKKALATPTRAPLATALQSVDPNPRPRLVLL